MWSNNIPRFQTGGQYVPGLQSSIFGAKLDRSVADTQEDLRNKAKRMKKGLFRGKIGRFLGKGAGKWLGKALTTGIAATNPLAALALSSAISAGTQRIGEKIGRGKDVKLRNTSGLLGSQYDDLKDYQKGADKASKGAAWDTFGEEILGGLKSDYGQKIWGDQLSDDFKTKVFGKNLGSKTHDELSKMNIGEMLGTKGAFFGAEDKLSDVGKEAYDWAGDKGLDAYNLYKKAGDWRQNLGQSIMDKFNQAKSSSMQTDYSSLTPEQSQIQYDDMYQDGGIVGYQEGGYKVDPDFDYVYVNEDEDWNEKDENQYKDWIDLVSKKNPKLLKEKDEPWQRWEFFDKYNKAVESGEFPPDSLFNVHNPDFISPNPMFHPDTLEKRRLEQEELRKDIEENPEQWRDIGMQEGGMAYPLQMAGGGYLPKQGFGGLIQYRKGY